MIHNYTTRSPSPPETLPCLGYTSNSPHHHHQSHRQQMSLSSSNRNARDQRLRSTGSRTPTDLESKFPGYFRLDPDIELSSTGWTSSECTSCLGEPNAGNCRLPATAQDHEHLSGCIDPICTEVVCDECSEHEDWCDECVADCGSDCGLSLGCDEPDIRDDDAYTFEGSHSELFGDQTAQTFGFGRPLPQLAKDDTMMESSDFCKIPDDTALSALPDYNTDQNSSGSTLQPSPFSQMPWTLQRKLTSPQATTFSRPNCISAYQASPSHALTSADISPLSHQDASSLQPIGSAHDSPDPTHTHAHHDHVSLPTGKSDCARPFCSRLQCQWADSTGKPCGKTLRLGEDMHEHLRSAHGVKNEVFCRWIGCSVGVSKASPHRFANSVERHTWGHSGYRPYKCSACNEGFAAASVRDEHFTNIHLRKKVFACDMCSHQCTSATNLKRHKDDKHSAERFQCEFCNRNGKRRLFPRGPNLARHLRGCKYVLAYFPEAAAAGKVKADWLPPGYKRGHHGMDRAKVTPPNYLPTQNDS